MVLAGVLASGAGFVVHDDAPGAVVNLASVRAQAKAEVDVLVSVPKRGVEPSGPLEVGSPHQHAGAGDGLETSWLIDCGMVFREARVNVSRRLIRADDDACVLDRLVWIQELGPPHRSLRMGLGILLKPVEPSRAGDRVVV